MKRVNNIHKDNEIYARKVIKVPSNTLSILLEKDYFTEEKNTNEKSLTTAPNSDKCDIIVETVNNSLVAKNPIENNLEEKNTLSPNSEIDETQESVSLLNTTIEHKTNDLSCSGADWGMSWHTLLCVTLVLGLGGPFIYVFWLFWGKKVKTTGS